MSNKGKKYDCRPSPIPGVRWADLPFEMRFEESYTINETNECWEWNKIGPGGYGGISLFGVSAPAHIASWERNHGIVPENLCVLHKCDNRKCVNPKHLYLGTKKQNRKDFIDRHPEAKTLMATAQALAAKGVKKFWDSMSKKERTEFCAMRREIQNRKASQRNL